MIKYSINCYIIINKYLLFKIGEEEILNNMFIDLNISNISPPVLSPLYFQNINNKIGPKQSDILKVNILSILNYYELIYIYISLILIN